MNPGEEQGIIDVISEEHWLWKSDDMMSRGIVGPSCSCAAHQLRGSVSIWEDCGPGNDAFSADALFGPCGSARVGRAVLRCRDLRQVSRRVRSARKDVRREAREAFDRRD